MRHRAIIILFAVCFSVAFAGSSPRPTATDERVKIVTYDPNNVVQITVHVGYTTTIEYEPNEFVMAANISCGDPIAWELTPFRNFMVVKPKVVKSTTNCTVITNRRVYLYELRTRTTQNPRDKRMTFFLRYNYPLMNQYVATRNNRIMMEKEREKTNEIDRDKVKATELYFGYHSSGDMALAPIQVFDDGRFTYFKFREKGDFPAIFSVDPKRNESIVNFRIENDYVVVEQLASRFTLRRGEQVVSILRTDMPGFESNGIAVKNGINRTRLVDMKGMENNYADW